jgi:hypothetical protein
MDGRRDWARNIGLLHPSYHLNGSSLLLLHQIAQKYLSQGKGRISSASIRFIFLSRNPLMRAKSTVASSPWSPKLIARRERPKGQEVHT